MKLHSKHLVIALVACVLGACRPTLQSTLPSGTPAYEALDGMRSQAGASNLLRPNDQVDVIVFQEENLSVEDATIDQAGNISLPLVGEVKAAGYSTSQLSRVIESAYATQYLRDPRVNVVLSRPAPRILTIEGEVKQAGVFEVQEGYTLLTALALAGSPLPTAKLDEVLVFRTVAGERYGGRFNATDIRAGRAPDPLVMPGDTIVVGYSAVRGAFEDFLKTAPVVGAFARY